MKYAVVRSGGKQYIAREGETIEVDRLPLDIGKQVSFDDVLLIADGNKVQVGGPLVKGASVKGQVLEQIKSKKIIVFKYIPKERYRRKKGHRQHYTRVRIDEIGMSGTKQAPAETPAAKSAVDEKPQAESPAAKPAPKKTTTQKPAPKKAATQKPVSKKTASKPKAQAKPKAEAETKPESKPKAESKPKESSKSASTTKAKTAAKAKPGAKSGAGSKASTAKKSSPASKSKTKKPSDKKDK